MESTPVMTDARLGSALRWRSTLRAWGPATRGMPLPTIAALLGLTALPTMGNLASGGRDFAGSLVAAGVLGATAAAFAVDDVAGETLAASPTSLARRRALRLGSLVLITGVVWAALILVASLRGSVAGSDLGDRAAEAAAVAGIALATAGWAHRRQAAGAALAGALGGGLAVLLVTALAQRFDGIPALMATTQHGRWWYLAATAWAVAAWTWRDPAR